MANNEQETKVIDTEKPEESKAKFDVPNSLEQFPEIEAERRRIEQMQSQALKKGLVVAPTQIPTKFSEQIAFYETGGSRKLYVNINNVWYALNAGGFFAAKLANDAVTGANTTPITVTGLVFSFEANSTYRIKVLGAVSPNAATTGCGLQFDTSVAVTSIWFQFYHALATSGTISGGYSVADDASAGVSSGTPAASNTPINGEGILVSGASAGTAQLRFRSEVAAVNTLKAGTILVVEKIL
jgi:hypothetical protein